MNACRMCSRIYAHVRSDKIAHVCTHEMHVFVSLYELHAFLAFLVLCQADLTF